MDITIVIAQILIPLGLLIWQGISHAKSQIGWVLKTALVLGYLTAIALAGLWIAIPWWTPYLYLGIWLVLTLVTLRHLKQGSVQVSAGDRVFAGQEIGKIGNSGDSGEPHLHIHAQRSGSDAAALDGDPLPMMFANRYLVRNARFESR